MDMVRMFEILRGIGSVMTACRALSWRRRASSHRQSMALLSPRQVMDGVKARPVRSKWRTKT